MDPGKNGNCQKQNERYERIKKSGIVSWGYST